MKATGLALVGLGAIGLIALSTSASAKEPVEEYKNILETGEIKKDTDLLQLANQLLSEGYTEESEQIKELHTSIYAPHMSEEEIQQQILIWKDHVSELYGVTWEQ